MTRLPSLSALRAFEVVGRTRSVRAAGEELAVSPTVISRHLQNLQSDIGIDLVEPHGRGLALTKSGEAFHAQLTRAFDLLRQAVHDARPIQRESLHIWCIPGIANRCLLPRLPELQRHLKTSEIILQPTLSRPDFTRAEADAEIVYIDELEEKSSVRAELLARPQVLAVASPSLRVRYPAITGPCDLLSLPLLHEESTQQWERYLRQMGLGEIPPLRGPRLWHAHLAIEAARLGQGVALANRLLVEDDLRAGRLVEVIASDVRLGGYYLIAPQGHWRDPAMKVLHTWLKSILREDGGTDASNASMLTNS
ncbi:LysR substrate-binding domain-containing protein [Microvirga sp. VF16]|uniref:LysR substrate-binding domain-containing protein n=1 Tax=Microvirga sp. VF16 TaxID=2807101 RepID=UPI00353023CC